MEEEKEERSREEEEEEERGAERGGRVARDRRAKAELDRRAFIAGRFRISQKLLGKLVSARGIRSFCLARRTGLGGSARRENSRGYDARQKGAGLVEWSWAGVSTSEMFHATLQLGRKEREWPEFDQADGNRGITEQQSREELKGRRKKPCPAQEQLTSLLTVCAAAKAPKPDVTRHDADCGVGGGGRIWAPVRFVFK